MKFQYGFKFIVAQIHIIQFIQESMYICIFYLICFLDDLMIHVIGAEISNAFSYP